MATPRPLIKIERKGLTENTEDGNPIRGNLDQADRELQIEKIEQYKIYKKLRTLTHQLKNTLRPLIKIERKGLTENTEDENPIKGNLDQTDRELQIEKIEQYEIYKQLRTLTHQLKNTSDIDERKLLIEKLEQCRKSLEPPEYAESEKPFIESSIDPSSFSWQIYRGMKATIGQLNMTTDEKDRWHLIKKMELYKKSLRTGQDETLNVSPVTDLLLEEMLNERSERQELESFNIALQAERIEAEDEINSLQERMRRLERDLEAETKKRKEMLNFLDVLDRESEDFSSSPLDARAKPKEDGKPFTPSFSAVEAAISSPRKINTVACNGTIDHATVVALSSHSHTAENGV